MSFVLDTSVALAWFFEDEFNDYARGVRAALKTQQAAAPWLWPVEMTNALAIAERRRRIGAAKVDIALRLLTALPVDVDAAAPSPPHLLALCRTHRRTAYDALYLDLALRDRLPLATLDGRMRRACLEAGIALYEPD